MPMSSNPVSSAEGTAVLNAIMVGVRAVLGNLLMGRHASGSPVTGEFDPNLSEIDVAAVDATDLDPNKFMLR